MAGPYLVPGLLLNPRLVSPAQGECTPSAERQALAKRDEIASVIFWVAGKGIRAHDIRRCAIDPEPRASAEVILAGALFAPGADSAAVALTVVLWASGELRLTPVDRSPLGIRPSSPLTPPEGGVSSQRPMCGRSVRWPDLPGTGSLSAIRRLSRPALCQMSLSP